MQATILFSIARLLLLHLVWRPLLAFSPSAIRCGVSRIRRNGWDLDNARVFKGTTLSAQPQNDENTMDDLRRMLESAWNMETMGRVPTSAVGAAEASVASLTEALRRRDEMGLAPSVPRLFFIDILLPQYDIAAGTNLYDEVLAVEFCIALANQLPAGKSEILVRDAKVLHTVTRVLNARDGTTFANSKGKQSREPKVDMKEIPASTPKLPLEPEFFDDFADFESPPPMSGNASDTTTSSLEEPIVASRDKGIPEDTSPLSQSPMLGSDNASYDGIDSFREMLLQSWDATVDLDKIPKDERLEEEDPVEPPPLERQASVEKRYRLASFLGEATISKGADMIDDVMQAVKANALPCDDEETLIMLSATTKEELYSVRAMVNKYKDTKTILLVNCKLDPLPQELLRAQTVYSILPLIARRAAMGTKKVAETASPKVVVLRRYPRDWEVYVDVGRGFDLAASIPANDMAMLRRGPSMEWISSAVKRYLQTRVL
jgi:Domain of unknown function (DUF1995)